MRLLNELIEYRFSYNVLTKLRKKLQCTLISRWIHAQHIYISYEYISHSSHIAIYIRKVVFESLFNIFARYHVMWLWSKLRYYSFYLNSLLIFLKRMLFLFRLGKFKPVMTWLRTHTAPLVQTCKSRVYGILKTSNI